jgi:hypothetical protein
LVEAAIKRQDDLRASDAKFTEMLSKHTSFVAELRATHAKELGDAESKRIDAVRAVDVAAVKTEADRALAAIQTLAVQAATKEETLRTSLTTTATAIAKQTSDIVSQLIERIAALEKSSYEGKGKEAVSDPMLSRMFDQLKVMNDNMNTKEGKGQGIEAVWGWIVAAAGSGGVLAYLAAHFSK